MRPSFVLGGRAMHIVYDEEELLSFIEEAQAVGENRPVLIDKFISDAIEVDVDAVSDGVADHDLRHHGAHRRGGHPFRRQRVRAAAAHALRRHPRRNPARDARNRPRTQGRGTAQHPVCHQRRRRVCARSQSARVAHGAFVSKAIGMPWAKIAAKVMAGVKLADIPEASERVLDYFAVKESVLPFNKFPGADTMLGPEMKSTGEVMGIDKDFGLAFAKSQEAAGNVLPRSGTVFISVKNSMRRNIIFMAKKIADMGFRICASEGTCKVLRSNGVNAKMVPKIGEGKPDIIDLIKGDDIDLIINVPAGKKSLDRFQADPQRRGRAGRHLHHHPRRRPGGASAAWIRSKKPGFP